LHVRELLAPAQHDLRREEGAEAQGHLRLGPQRQFFLRIRQLGAAGAERARPALLRATTPARRPTRS
jgi:hypothetical protein